MTHPLFQATNQEVDTLVKLWRDYGAYTELAFVNIAMDHLSYEQYVQVIEAVGPEGVVLTTDLGQAMNTTVSDGWREYIAELKRRGVKDDAIAQMAVLNPHRILYGRELAALAPPA
jgi:microsomal dipeptidase-like Zn-dependent dipeptidase